MLTFIEHPTFTRQIRELMSDEAYAEFQTWLASNPEQGDVIPGLDGLRKVRVALPGHGKRGGARFIYLLLLRVETVVLFYAYTKGAIEDLTPEQKRRLRDAVQAIKREFRA
jgi:hypothetical protein